MATPQKPKRPVRSDANKRALKSAPRKGGVVPLQKSKRRLKWVWISLAAFVVFLIVAFLTPPYGTIRYGICKTFVELNDPYPQSLEFVQAEEIGTVVILDYNKIDSFGQRSLNQIRCFFNKDPRVVELDRVDVNGRSYTGPLEDPELIKKFNVGLPSLLSKQPSLLLPQGLPQNVKDYK